jgi:NADH:ubiquinone oxidoreductase subunit E
LEEQSCQDNFIVEGCDCQGECGYGPNILVDGQIINNVRGTEAILQACGMKADVNQSIPN